MVKAVAGVILVAILALLGADTPAEHVAAARAAARQEHTVIFNRLCPASPASPARAASPVSPAPAVAPGPPDRSQWHAEPAKVFDNLYFVGQTEYSSWAVTTSAGIVLVDAIFDYSVEDEVVGGLKKLDLDPAAIKYVVVSHAHRDHVGGARYLQDHFGAHVVMSAADWDLIEHDAGAWPKPKRDIVATDGQTLTLGDTTLTLYVTPGHTYGTLSTLIPVKDHGVPHLVAEWGGTMFNWVSSPAQYVTAARPPKFWFDTYSRSAERFRDIVSNAGADVLISNHTEYDGTTAKIAALSNRKPGEPNPYVVGTESVMRYLTVADECAKAGSLGAAVQAAAPARSPMDTIAEQYVKLVLAVGEHDADYVDAFYGPGALKAEATQTKKTLAQIGAEADRLIASTASSPSDGRDEMLVLRREYLHRQLEALRAKVRMLGGTKMTFDEESRALYDAVAPTHPDAYFTETLAELGRELPGTGSVVERYDRFRSAFVIPTNRLSTVFDRAIAECRARTLKHVALPPSESFTVEYVKDKSWSGYNWYQGGFRSLIQVNTDLPIYIDRAVDLACHEGYPGHHVYNVLLEKTLVNDRGWSEFTVYPLFSPQSLIAEGTANYGIEVAFPGPERVAFERDVLFPLAGLDASRAAEYYRIQALVDRLSYAGNEAARRYLNGKIDRAAAVEWLTRYAMMPKDRAEQRTRFFDKYRSYVINYNLGKDLVRDYIESRDGGRDERRWSEFMALLASPRLPSALRTAAR